MSDSPKVLKILAVPFDAVIPPAAEKSVIEHGIVIIRTATPETVRIVCPSDDIDLLPANEFMWAALDALTITSEKNYSMPDVTKVRERFVSNLSDVATRKRRKLIGWSAEEGK